jgi:hypothetical protein
VRRMGTPALRPPVTRPRAPREDRAVLAEPPLTEAGKLLEKNRHVLDRPDIIILGQSLTELRRAARRSAVAAARGYLEQAGEPVPEGDLDSLCVSGHQPELFHPGVWVKNFALCGLAKRHGALPLNLIIDSDAPKSTALRVPVWRAAETAAMLQAEAWRVVQVPYDDWHGEIPYEERSVQNEGFFASFAERLRPLAQAWNFEPLLAAFWGEAASPARRAMGLGERFASARRVFERQWGCHNLEVPLSRLLSLEPGGTFICHVLANMHRFHLIYNDAVRSYRDRYGQRSRTRPVPDLAQYGDWLEAPFWVWQVGQKRRSRLFVRAYGGTIELQVGGQSWPALSLQDPLPAWRRLVAAGHKIRTRALTTTMFARLLLADLFLHGIGGALYDEITDEIMHRFYGIEPPSFLTLSATLLLPFPRFAADERACLDLAHTLRDLHWNPQRHVAEASLERASKELADARRAWTARVEADRAGRRRRFEAIRALNRGLRPFLYERERSLAQRLQACRADAAANQILARRDYAFCLYPEAELRPFLRQFLNELL